METIEIISRSHKLGIKEKFNIYKRLTKQPLLNDQISFQSNIIFDNLTTVQKKQL